MDKNTDSGIALLKQVAGWIHPKETHSPSQAKGKLKLHLQMPGHIANHFQAYLNESNVHLQMLQCILFLCLIFFSFCLLNNYLVELMIWAWISTTYLICMYFIQARSSDISRDKKCMHPLDWRYLISFRKRLVTRWIP